MFMGKMGLGFGLRNATATAAAALLAMQGGFGLTLFSRDNSMAIRDASTPANDYNGAPGAKLTTTRASGATYWDSAGVLQTAGNNVLRCDFDPRLSSTTERCGYLIEEARTNLALQSEDITTTWGQNATTRTANAAIAPDGAMTADLITPTSGNSNHFISQAITHTAASYTISAFVKPNGYTKCGFRENTTLGSYATFDCFGAGSALNTAGGASGAIVALPNGYYRVSMTYTGAAAAQTMGFYVLDAAYTTGNPDSYTYVGDTVSGMYAWGFQDELGAFASSYIPTAGSTVTRAADLVTLAGTLFPLNQSEGTLYAKFGCIGVPTSVDANILTVSGATAADERHSLARLTSRKTRFQIIDGMANVVVLDSTGTVSDLTQAKVAGAYKADDSAAAMIGETVQSDNTCTMPTTTHIIFGNRASDGARALNGWLFEAAYFPIRKTNSQLQALASGYASDALLLMGAETQGLTFSATDQSMSILDTGTPANNYTGDLVTKLGAIRASAGYHYNSAGLLVSSASGLRLDYDSRLTGGPGYLVEEARTNLCLQSQVMGTTWSNSANTLTADAVAAPDGTTTADLLTPTSANSAHNLTQAITHTVATWTFSVYLKPNGYTKFGIRENTTVGSYATFNCSGAGSVLDSSNATGTITAIANGWYRVTMAYTGAATAQTMGLYVLDAAYTTGTPHSYTYIGDTTSGMYVWGAQDEAGAFATSYIPTTIASVTRAADRPLLTGTAFPLSQTAGTLVARHQVMSATSPNQYLLTLDDNTSNEFLALRAFTDGNPFFAVKDGGVSQANIDAGTTVALALKGFAGAFAVNDFAASYDGGAAVTDASGTLPTTTQIVFGDGVGGSQMCGWLRHGRYFPTRKSNADLATLAAAA